MTYSEYRTEQNTFESEDGNIKYIDKGKGNVILMIHGVPTSGWLYRKLIDSLVAQGNRVIVPDMLGFGSSDSPKGYLIYSEQQHAKRISALMAHLNINNWHHVMHDAGGIWTWELFKLVPEKINKLTILNSVILQEGFIPPVKMKPGFLAKTAMWMYRQGLFRGIMLKQLFKVGLYNNQLTKQDKKGYSVPLKEGKTNGMYYFFTQTNRPLPDYSTEFEKIKIPVQIIWGKYDKMLQWTPQSKLVKEKLHISESNIHIIEAKHFIQEEKPSEIGTLILGF